MSQTKAQLISDLVQALNFTGTSSAPANGMYLSAANTIKLATNSNGRLTIDSSGNAVFTGTCTATTFVGALTGTASGNAVLTGSTNNQIVTITGANAIQGETKLTFSGALLDFAINNGAQGFRIAATGDHYPIFEFDANRAGAGSNCGQFDFKWDGTNIARIATLTGDDTTNKDNGRLAFMTSTAGTLAEALRIDPDGKIGINETTPAALIEIVGTTNKEAEVMFNRKPVQGTANSIIGQLSFYNNDDSVGLIACKREAANDAAYLQFATQSSTGTGLQERMRIKADGKVGIGTSSPANTLHLGASGADQKRSIKIDGTNGSSELQGVILENDGENALFHIKAAAGGGTPSEKLTLHAITGNVYIGTTTSHAGKFIVKDTDNSGNQIWVIGRANDNTGSISFRNNGDAAYTGRIQCGDTNGMEFNSAGSTRASLDTSGNFIINDGNLKILTGGHGINFSAFATSGNPSSNLLDDYEEGTWTPTLNKSGAAGTVNSGFTHNIGKYIKVGKMLWITFYIQKDNSSFGTGTGEWYIDGLPFAVASTAAGAWQSIPLGYFGVNGSEVNQINANARLQANNTNGTQTLAMCGTSYNTNWTTGSFWMSATGSLMVS